MARVADGAEAGTPLLAVSSRQHFVTITWLRWRIFRNSLRGKGAAGELAVKILSYPFLAVIVLGPSIGAGFAGYYLVSKDLLKLLSIPLWIIFALWQFIGISTSTTGPSFNLSSMVRFPIRYRDYLLIRLSFGLLDPPTVAGICCLIAMSLGIAIADVSLLPWAALVLFVFAVCNIFFSRVVYSWMERWLAQRRTRELLTGLILAVSLGIQFAAQFAQRLGHKSHHLPLSPFWRQTTHVVMVLNLGLPPGLTASSIDHMHRGAAPLIATAALCGLLAYTTAFLLLLHLRLCAEYRGEDLSEAPAAGVRIKTASGRDAAAARAQQASSAAFSFLPAKVAAGLFKEIHYLLRSGPKLYTLILPVFMVFVFSMRTSGMNYVGAWPGGQGLLFSYGCAYTQLIFAALLYNSLGSDGAGVQFYFIAPLRMRDVMLAKNLLAFGIFSLEVILIYVGSSLFSLRAPADLTVATIAWSLFSLFLNMSVGNIRSIVSPKVVDQGKMRSQNVSGLNGLISLAVNVFSVILGGVAGALCHFLHYSYWPAAAAFFVLAAFAFILYLTVLGKVDGIAARHAEDLTRILAKV